MERKIWFDMDGTIADLYGVDDWVHKIDNGISSPYAQARPLVNMSVFARELHKKQKSGIKIGIISWLSRSGTDSFNDEVKKTKLNWLKSHLPSVEWDEINIVPYGTPKHKVGAGVLFDDNKRVRAEWEKCNTDNIAFTQINLISVLKGIV